MEIWIKSLNDRTRTLHSHSLCRAQSVRRPGWQCGQSIQFLSMTSLREMTSTRAPQVYLCSKTPATQSFHRTLACSLRPSSIDCLSSTLADH